MTRGPYFPLGEMDGRINGTTPKMTPRFAPVQ